MKIFVLSSDGNRENEHFMEVHIFGELSVFAVKKMFVPKARDKKVSLEIGLIKAKFPDKIFEV